MTESIRVIIHFALKTFRNLLIWTPAFFILNFSFFIIPASAQTTRIHFVLDASGSMKGEWKGTSKFELAKNILNNTIDSVSRTNQKVEFALRVFGHQSPRASLNCKDTRLEAAFTKGNAAVIAQRLKTIHPQGQTPIEYTLLQSLDDFPEDSLSTNAIILITDGSETCGGNLCDLTRKFEEKKIALRPFIVGLGLSDSLKKKFECLGSFYDVQNEDALSSAMKIVISRVLNPTTCQFNLLDAYGNPNETNVEITLYDHATKAIRYSFIHTLNAKGIPDTLTLDQRFVYDLEVHSIPAVVKEKIQLVPGIHNVIPAEVPMGSLEIRLEALAGIFPGISCIVRKATEKEILFVQDVNSSLRYITGAYDLEVLTLPRTVIKNVLIQEAKITSIKIPRSGTMLLNPSEAGIASIFLFREKVMEKVYEFSSIKTQKSVSLQPGNYLVVFRGERYRQAERTKQISVEILSGKTSSIRL